MRVRKYRDARTGVWYLRWWEGDERKFASTGLKHKPVAEALRKKKEQELGLAEVLPSLDAILREKVQEAIQSVVERLPAFGAGGAPKPPSMTVQEALKAYLEAHRAKGNSESHVENVERQIRLFVESSKLKDVSKYEPAMLVSYLAGVRAAGQGDKSVMDKQIIVTGWIKWLTEPKPLPMKKLARLDVRYFSAKEVEDILARAADGDPRVTALVAMAIYAGLRRGELLRLEWTDVDLAGRTIRVRNKPGNATKTRISRTVPILDQLLPHLQRLKREPELLFPWKDPRGVTRRVMRLVKAATQREEDAFLTARHTAITWWLVHGLSIKLAAQWAGNSPEVIESNYEGVLPHGAKPLEMTFMGQRLLPTGLPTRSMLEKQA
jgi:integrase